MKGKMRVLVAMGLLSLSTTSAWSVISIPNGWYIEGNVGSTKAHDKSYPGKASTSGTGGNVDIGYKFMPYFGMELGYTRYANTIIKDGFGNKAGRDMHDDYDFVGKAMLPIVDSGFEAFAKLGVHRLLSRVRITDQGVANSIGLGAGRHTTTGIYMAVGGQYSFIPDLGVNIQWARAKGNNHTATMDLVSVGLTFIFG